MKRMVSVLTLLLLFLPPSFGDRNPLPAAVYFDDSDPVIMILGNDDYYEIGLRKANGSIAYITDKTTGQNISQGSRGECLWGAVFDGPAYVGGCSYNAAWANHFDYTWSAATHTLTLDYAPDPAASQQVTARATLTASTLPWFDLHLHLQNDWGYRLNFALFPSDLVFVEDDIESALLPILPGIVLKPSFFDQDRGYITRYPGLFADYVSVTSTTGQMAIYSLYDSGPLQPVFLGFVHDDEYVADSTFYYHTFGAGVSDGDAWDSPRVRVTISQSAPDTIAAYRTDNSLDQFPSLSDKLGVRYDPVIHSPLLKADAFQLGVPFSEYAGLLAGVPSPGILHPLAFQPGGHDENYPDLLPPDPAWGTIDEFAAMFRQAQALGFLVMPYTNPTWWDDESPTLQNLPPPLDIDDIAVLDAEGQPMYEYYGPHGGYVVSPSAPFVQARLAELVEDMARHLPSDLLFEDQIGARTWLFDYNPSSSSPTTYSQGWLAHTRTYTGTPLMTEMGFDRLAETESGFHGSVLLSERSGATSDWWGTGNWHPYPLAPLMARDKVLFYQHNLATDTMTVDKATLTWNVAFGYMLSYDLGYGGGLDNPWLNLVSVFQRHLLAHYAGEVVTGFANLAPEVTRTTFETFAVTANWDKVSPYDAGPHTLSRQGFLATNSSGSLTGGVFTRYNDAPLSAGDHYLIEQRDAAAIVVRQPIGADTSIRVQLLPGWSAADPILARAFSDQGQIIDTVPVTVTAQAVTFAYRQELAGQSVAYYRLSRSIPIFLPIVTRRF